LFFIYVKMRNLTPHISKSCSKTGNEADGRTSRWTAKVGGRLENNQNTIALAESGSSNQPMLLHIFNRFSP
jgi:hypothetical protein